MLAPILGVLLSLQQPPCLPPAMQLMSQAAARASQFNLPAALELLRAATGCDPASVAAVYVQGMLDARSAARDGGTAESLAPLRRAIGVLEILARSRPGPAEIARLVLQAAAAAAQTERGEMRLYLESALQMEAVEEARGRERAPLLSAAEMAGILWLQVHGYDEARAAFADAERRVGPTPQVLLGLARAAMRLGDGTSACMGYRRLLDRWDAVGDEPVEIVEGRTYLARPECRTAGNP